MTHGGHTVKLLVAVFVAGAGAVFGLAWDLFGYRRGAGPQ